MATRNVIVWLFLAMGVFQARAPAAECYDGDPQVRLTDEYWFQADDASGAKGDVVGVTVTLHRHLLESGPSGLFLSICHDPEAVELLGEPLFTDDLVSVVGGMLNYWQVDETSPVGNQEGYGLLVYCHLSMAAMSLLEPGEPLPLMTLYYRLKGDPGSTTSITFCDSVLARYNARCNYNLVFDPGSGNQLVSTRNVAATLSVVPGPVTNPDRPPPPPEAKVYPSMPSDEEVNCRVRITGAVASPGQTGVPLDVFVTADLDYVGIEIPIDFDERYVRIARVEDFLLGGWSLIDNRSDLPGANAEEGHVGLVSSIRIGNRRVAAAGETKRIARLYVDVLASAAEIQETSFEVRPFLTDKGFHVSPHIYVRALDNSTGGGLLEEVRQDVAPISITGGMLAIRPASSTVLGDSNADGRFDISDAVAILGHLFLGTGMMCPVAADTDQSGVLEITDAIVILSHLFLGESPERQLGTEEVPCF